MPRNVQRAVSRQILKNDNFHFYFVIIIKLENDEYLYRWISFV